MDATNKQKLSRTDRTRMARDREEMLYEDRNLISDRERAEIEREIAILLHPTNDAFFVDSNYVRDR
jgi:hypothetical protein